MSTKRAECFHWAAIIFSQTLGIALSDWVAGTGGLGYLGGAGVFAAGLLVLVALYAGTGVSQATLFWAAIMLTRPLGATMGDFLDKPLAAEDGGRPVGPAWERTWFYLPSAPSPRCESVRVPPRGRVAM